MDNPWLWAGASGYSYKEWKGPFYPDELAADDMLAWYAQRLGAVEINNTFYRNPKREVLAKWAAATPPHFRFAIKATRRITHDGRLKADAVAEPLRYLYGSVEALGPKLGAVLFQLPPNLKKDVTRLQAFLALLPADHRAALGAQGGQIAVEKGNRVGCGVGLEPRHVRDAPGRLDGEAKVRRRGRGPLG